MKSDRWFYSAAGAVFLILMVIGFRAFITAGTGANGRQIDPKIFALVATHGAAIGCWFVLFFVQSLLISTGNRRVHMKLGWSSLAIGATIAVTGFWVGIRSVQSYPPEYRVFDMVYWRFMLMALTEIVMFTVFLTAGLLVRKQPKIHRVMMLLASLSILSGATARIPFMWKIYGHAGWQGLFGPVFTLGLILLLVRYVRTRSLDRWFAAGYAACVVVFVLAGELALTSAWGAVASRLFKY